MNFLIEKEEELIKISHYIQKEYPEGVVVLLIGDLGAGKSTFVKYFAKELGIHHTASPTFSIMNNYDDKIFHYDIYKDGSEEFFSKGLGENLAVGGFHFIEWADERVKNYLELIGVEYITLTITPKENKREVIIDVP